MGVPIKGTDSGRDAEGRHAGLRARQEVGRAGPSDGQGGEVDGPGWLSMEKEKWRRGNGERAIILSYNEGLHVE